MKGKMKAAHLKGYHDFRIVEVDIPTPAEGQALVRIDKVGICGSDRGIWDNHHFFNDLYDWEDFSPGEHGHEAVGTVVELGPNTHGVKVGDQVVRLNLRGSADLEMACFAEYTLTDCAIVCNGADPEVMCFTDPVSVGLNHVYHANVTPGDTVVVMGQGLLGLIVTQLLVHNHVRVIATDIYERRLKLAEGFGATVYNPESVDLVEEIRALDTPVQAVIECSGADEAVDAACHILSRGGRVVIMGATRKQITFNYTQMRIKGAMVCFPMNNVHHKDNWEPAANLLMQGCLQVKEFVDKRDRLENIQQVLENYDDEWIRVILEP
jgi:threonine dehydrogenase-like Zn-dependent dehydrogenase